MPLLHIKFAGICHGITLAFITYAERTSGIDEILKE